MLTCPDPYLYSCLCARTWSIPVSYSRSYGCLSRVYAHVCPHRIRAVHTPAQAAGLVVFRATHSHGVRAWQYLLVRSARAPVGWTPPKGYRRPYGPLFPTFLGLGGDHWTVTNINLSVPEVREHQQAGRRVMESTVHTAWFVECHHADRFARLCLCSHMPIWVRTCVSLVVIVLRNMSITQHVYTHLNILRR